MRILNTLLGVVYAQSVSNGEVHVVGQVEHDVARITSCNDVNNKIALTINVDQDYFDGGDGWGLIGDDWVKEFPLEELENMGVVQNQLVMGTTINLNRADGLFFDDGDYSLSFKCFYSLAEQILDVGTTTTISSFGVQARNHHHVVATGSLNYKLTITTPTQEIGEKVEFSIEPLNPGVIYNRVTECTVSNGDDEYFVFGGDVPFCADEFTDFTAISGYGSTGLQRFSYTAFKWGDDGATHDRVDEQNIKCRVEFKARPFVDIDLHACDGNIPVTTTSSTTRPTARTTDPSATIEPIVSTSTPLPPIITQSTTLAMVEDSQLWTIDDIVCPDPRWAKNILCKRKVLKQQRQKKRKEVKRKRLLQVQANKANMKVLRATLVQVKKDIRKAT